MARPRFVFESRHFLFPKRKPPLAFAAHSFFQIPPPAKNQNGEERQGERAGRAVLRAWRDSGDRSVRCSFKPPRTRSVRSQFRSKKVRAKDMITQQIETSSSERADARRDAGAACDNSSRRTAANWLGGGNPKCGDLSRTRGFVPIFCTNDLIWYKSSD